VDSPGIGRTRLTGWARSLTSSAWLRPAACDELPAVIAGGSSRGSIARGLGRSYNDAALNGGGQVVTITPEGGHTDTGAIVAALDPATGALRAEAVWSLDEILRAVVPLGWFVPVTPGTRFVTVGGAIAADIHGKNHHVDGSFCDHLDTISLVLPDGTSREVTPSDSLFWATTGGMGLTGVITRADLRLRPIATSSIVTREHRTTGLDATMSALTDADSEGWTYSVAWLDGSTSTAARGRGVASLGRHALADDLPPGAELIRPPPSRRIAVPAAWPANVITPATVRVFNEAWLRKAPAAPLTKLTSAWSFFHPLDGIAGWNLAYGRRGFVQHQMVVPFEKADAIGAALNLIQRAKIPSFLTVLKRMGPANQGLLSFPMEGWTLAVDLPNVGRRLSALLDQLDELAVVSGGRVYLAKDANLTRERFARMEPRLAQWQQARREIDPERRMQSDLSRRLDL